MLSSVRGRAGDLVALAAAGTLPDRIVSEQADDEFIQVVGRNGGVIASSPDLRAEPPVVRLEDGEWAVSGVPYDDERFLVYAAGTRSGNRDVQVILGRTLEPIAEMTALVGSLLAVGLPIVLGAMALLIWLVVGWALAPVERMRAEVDGITAAELHRRVAPSSAQDEIAGRVRERR